MSKKGSYLDDAIKTRKHVPGPCSYKNEIIWVTKRDIEYGKRRPTKTVRETYIETIFKDNKKNPLPGVGKYNLFKSEEEIKKENESLK